MTKLLSVFLLFSLAGCTHAAVKPEQPVGSSHVEVTIDPNAVYSPAPSDAPMGDVMEIVQESEPALLYMSPKSGTNVNQKFASDAIHAMNEALWSGCLRKGVMNHTFKSLHTFDNRDPMNPEEAWKKFIAGAPYEVELRWYRGSIFSKVIGYTYNTVDGTTKGASETRIWSNTRKMGNAKQYAAHLAHELSHQKRAGGFVHYTVFNGSFPYDFGDIMAACLK